MSWRQLGQFLFGTPKRALITLVVIFIFAAAIVAIAKVVLAAIFWLAVTAFVVAFIWKKTIGSGRKSDGGHP